jgi:hypothetical protein
MSVQARDRKIQDWYEDIKRGKIKLPRFQRLEAWDKGRISSLLSTIIHNLPLGITLILEVGDEEKFISRYISTAEPTEQNPRVTEHLLDGQQRLTAIWRALHNNYQNEKYFLYLDEYNSSSKENEENDVEDLEENAKEKVICVSRWINNNNKKMPIWADIPEQCLKRGLIPIDLLRPEDISNEIKAWVDSALEYKKPKNPDELEDFFNEKEKLKTKITSFRETIKHYNLPYLSLPTTTSKDTALNVFINMNTNSKPLTQYDIIVAEIEGLKETSIHDLQTNLKINHPAISRYFDLSYLILNTSALMQEKMPNRVGIWDMDKKVLVDNWDNMVKGLSKMASFLEEHKIFDEERLPTNAVLAVISALFTKIPETGDKAGQAKVLLKKYLWSSFFTDRYENAAASRAYADYIGLSNILSEKKKDSGVLYTENDVPVLNRTSFPLATEEQLLPISWPKSVGIRGRGILAVANYFGAKDFADGSEISVSNVKIREYHHIFPDALIKEANEFFKEEKINSTIALNCALITDTTNRKIGRKEPLTYLKERYNWTNENIVNQRLQSHLIPIEELKDGSYDGLNEEEKANKIKSDYEKFIAKRASFIVKAVEKLANGEDITSTEVIGF